MLKLVSDENFNADILRSPYRQRPDLDVVRVQEVGLSATPDLDILGWAAVESRILLTQDRDTMSYFSYHRVKARRAMPRVFLVSDLMPIRQAIDDSSLLSIASPGRNARISYGGQLNAGN